MKTTIVSRQLSVPKEFKAMIEKKLSKLDKFFKDDADAHVTLSEKRGKEIVELTIFSGSTIFRAERDSSKFAYALDEAIDILERQIRKNKTRLEKRLSSTAFENDAEYFTEEEDYRIHEKYFELIPMSREEAILRMNLLGHQFFMFRDEADGKICVVYRPRDEEYGLIIPQD